MGRSTYSLTVKIGALRDASYERNLNKAMKNLDGLESTAKRVVAGVAAAFAAVNVTRLAEDAIGTYSDFEQAMANTAATANASAADYEKLERAAREAGRTTTLTATESAEALGYMALAGWNTQESVSGLLPILRLAEATGAELKETSDLVTDSMSAMGLGIKDITGYLDELAAGNNSSNTTAIQLMESLVKTGGAARALGVSLEDTITAVGILANNGTKAEQAGTAMNSMLTRLASNDKAKDALDEIGVSIYDADGKFIGLKNTLIAIEEQLSGMSAEDSTVILKNLAGTEYFSKMNYLLAGVHAGADGAASAWEDLEDKIVNSEGALDTMNQRVTATLSASWERVKSAANDAKIGIVDEFGGDATQMLDALALKIPSITDGITDFLDKHKKDIYDALETGGELLGDLSDKAVNLVDFLIDNGDAVVGVLTSIGSALFIKKGIDLKNSLWTVLGNMTSPLKVIAGLSVAVGVLTGIATAVRRAADAASDANLDEHFGNIALSLEDLQDVASQIVQGDDLETIAQMLEAAGDTEDKLRGVTRALHDLSSKSWKISAGFGLGRDESENYAAQVEDFVTQTQDYVDAKGYEIHVAASLLFGENSDKVTQSDANMRELDAQITRYGDYVSSRISQAMEDGIITKDEDKVIQLAIQQLDRMTTKISEAETEAHLQAIQLKYGGKDLDKDTFMQLEDEIGQYVNESSDAALQAYETAMSSYNAKKGSAGYSDEQYESDASDAKLAYFKKRAEYVSQGTEYLTNAIEDAYPKVQAEMDRVKTSLEQSLQDVFTDQQYLITNGDSVTWGEILNEAVGSVQLSDSTTRDAIGKLYDQMLPLKTEMENLANEYMEAGAEIPKALMDGLNEINNLGALSGDTDAVYEMVQKEIGNNAQYQSLIDTAREQGAFIPESISDAIADNQHDVTSSIDGMYAYSNQYFRQVFSRGFDVSTNVRFTYDATGTKSKDTPASVLDNLGTYTNPLPSKPVAHAKGGIFDKPHYGLLAEAGPEAYIPLDGSQHAVSIWEQAGQLLGMGQQSRDEALYAGAMQTTATGTGTVMPETPNIQILYNPSITIKGAASEDEVRHAVSLGADDVIKIIKDYIAGQARVSFRRN